jgi:hypothetical protein
VTNADFDHKLRTITGEDASIRPFVCNGSPLNCCVFVVGFNPASPIPFWPFWHPQNGFDKAAWSVEYLRLKGKWSPTRLRINLLSEKLLELLPYASCLETNIYSYPSPDEKSLDKSQRDTEVLKFLLAAIRPNVVLFHGKKATAFGMLLKAPSFQIKTGKHLRFLKKETIFKVAEEISSLLQ